MSDVKKEVKEKVKKISVLSSKDEQIKKLTNLTKKLARDLDDANFQTELAGRNLLRTLDQKKVVEDDIRTMVRIFDKYGEDCGCHCCNTY